MLKKKKMSREEEKLHIRLSRRVGQALADYNMIQQGDRIMVCVSGGKDSFALLDVLLALQERAPIEFKLVAVNLDQKQPGFPEHVLPDYLTRLGVPFHIEAQDTYSVVKRIIPEGQTTCSLCSRLRRGHFYRVATELKATKIALGHHRDDVLETLLMNLLTGGKLASMAPKLVSEDGAHTVIRPLVYVEETDLARYAELKMFPLIPCDLCGSQEKLQRQKVKAILEEWEHQFPRCKDSMIAALSNVSISHLMDKKLFDFSSLQPQAKKLGKGLPDGEHFRQDIITIT
jgi:tRNA 2-thiocytidine biosynthesis protein TtcA